MSALLERTEAYVTRLLEEELDPAIHYHNLEHTQRVVKSTKEIVSHESVSAQDAELILLAAWLHDIGYTKEWKDHEEISASMAEEFLRSEGVEQEMISEVLRLIRATRFEAVPADLKEGIIRDADCAHLALPNYHVIAGQLRQELEQHRGLEFTDETWTQENIKMLGLKQKYYTNYAKTRWQPEKEDHLKELLKSQEKAIKKLQKNKKKSSNPDRAAQTLYRVTLQNHLKLSDIADTKANILLSVNAIIISLALSSLIPKLDSISNQHLIIPTLVLVVFSVISIVFAIMSTRPNVSEGEFTKEDVEQRKVNLLFFGNFYKMPYKDYEAAMEDMIQDADYMYRSLTRDLYYLGLVLARKYKLLRVTYTIFLIGIVTSVIAFVISFYMLET